MQKSFNTSHFFIIGAGGHAHVLGRLAELLHYTPVLIRQNSEKESETYFSIVEEDFLSLPREQIHQLICGVGAVGKQTVRERILAKYASYDSAFTNLIHPQAYVDASSRLGRGIFIAQGVQVVRGACLDDHVLLNTGAVVEHDVHLGVGSSLGPRAVLCGEVVCKAFTHVGAGATVLQGVHIAERTVIGAGAVLLHAILESEGTWVGVPAKRLVKKTLEKIL